MSKDEAFPIFFIVLLLAGAVASGGLFSHLPQNDNCCEVCERSSVDGFCEAHSMVSP